MNDRTLQDIIAFAREHNACNEAMEWMESLPSDTTPQAAWELCLSEVNRPDWAMWFASRATDDTKSFQWIALEIAESVQHLAPEESQEALKQVRAFMQGDDIDIDAAARAAADAAYAADAAAYAAADAAARAAADAAARAAACAAYAADAAAYAAADAAARAAADAAARAAACAAACAAAYAAAACAAAEADAKTTREICHIVLKYYPTIPLPERTLK